MRSLCSLLFYFPLLLSAQYFQQEVDYRIDARLDDETDILHAALEINYTNNAPEALDTLVFHLWPRAYSNDRTAFAKQKLRDGSTRFHFSEAKQRGTIDSLDFQVGGESISWQFDAVHPDIAYLLLPESLASGASIVITTPFRLKIPASFSRLGRVGDSYQMTQWYPKPAVYDQNGWHPMPYLDRGEFYSEFGSFDVSLTLPKNYLVAATGTLQTPAERDFLLEKAQRDAAALAQRNDLSNGFVREPFPPSAPQMKTIRYTAERVHDFAWFADKRFKVLHMGANNPQTGQSLEFWSFFTETEAAYWQKSLVYLEHAIEFYSEKVGLYPYPQVTAVQSALSAGGGMEYPMITVIARNGSPEDLDEVLAHEVGHNWFYGILATNERVDPWLDEGFNSYYEGLYMQRWYPDYAPSWKFFGARVNLEDLGYRYQNRLKKEQSPSMDSDSMLAANYWLNAYSKPDMALQHIAKIHGQAAVDRAMQAYYQRWQFKHPQPADVKAVFEESIGADLAWFFDDLMQSGKTYDYSVSKGRQDSVIVKRKGIDIPVVVGPLDQPKAEWLVLRDIPEQGYALPPGEYEILAGPLDLYPDNNVTDHPLALRPVTSVEAKPGAKRSFVLPLLGANAQNGLLLGAGFHNRTLEPRKLEFLIAPMYGLKSNSVNGFGGFRWRLDFIDFPDFIRSAMLEVGYQRFAYRKFREEPYHYNRTGIASTFNFAHPAIKQLSSGLRFQYINLGTSRPSFDIEGQFLGPVTDGNTYLRLEYFRENNRVINPSTFRFRAENGGTEGPFTPGFNKLELILTGGYQYQKNKFINWRFFGGYLFGDGLRNSNFNPNFSFSLVGNAASDYAYDDLYLGRQDDRSFGQQLSQRMGGFRAPINRAFGFGLSNQYMVTTNLDFELPFTPENFPLGVFLDAGVYERTPIRADSEAAFQWAGGFSLSFFKGAVGIYAPLFSSPDLGNLLDQRGGFLQQLSFRLSLQELMPWRWLDNLAP